MNARFPHLMLVVLAASHAVNDFLAGWLLVSETPGTTEWGRLPWLVVYAALAFAGQLPAAWVIDRARQQDRWLAAALVLMFVAVALRGMSFGAAVVVSGVASALIHVAGGALALQLPNGARAIGWFSAPGIVGLTLGGWLGHSHNGPALWAALLPAALLAAWAALRPHWPAAENTTSRTHAPAVDAHDGLMLLILLALTLRSTLWDVVQVAQLGDTRALFAIAVSAAAGKVAGGWLASRWPHSRQISLVLLAACALLDLARWHLAGLCAGVALMQSTIPSSVLILNRSFGTPPARAAAYGLGVTVAVGGLIAPVLPDFPVLIIALATLALLMLWRALRREMSASPG